MKIGIMSMQRIKNYGSFLQAYGLRKILNELGYNNVEFVDYKVEKPIVTIKRKKLINRIQNKIKRLINFKKEEEKKQIIRIFNERYEKEFLPLLNIYQEKNYNHDIDYLIIGSDEVFNCIQSNPDVGYSKELFGQGYEKSTILSYAACFGGTNYEKLKEYGIEDEIANFLIKFKSISVRDINSFNTVNKLINVKPEINLDPVLIADFGKLNDDVVKHKDYIVLYAYTDRISEKEGKAIRNFAKKQNKKIISIGTYQNCADIHLVLTPFEMLAYIKNADYIITDTFHGAIFSIKYNKKFVTILRESNKEKLGDLLKRLRLENRQIKELSMLDNVLTSNIDYSETNSIIEAEKQNARKYLTENIK